MHLYTRSDGTNEKVQWDVMKKNAFHDVIYVMIYAMYIVLISTLSCLWFVLVYLDALGQTIRQVKLLEMRSPRDPCDALLHDWAASTPDATVEHLLSMLKEMERLDVVMRLEDYIEGNEPENFENYADWYKLIIFKFTCTPPRCSWDIVESDFKHHNSNSIFTSLSQ